LAPEGSPRQAIFAIFENLYLLALPVGLIVGRVRRDDPAIARGFTYGAAFGIVVWGVVLVLAI
jgi:hypothetical protein